METNRQQGFTLFVTVVLTAVMLAVSMGLVRIAAKEKNISNTQIRSHVSYYAAESGVACAKFWDTVNPDDGGESKFATSTSRTFICDNQTFSGGGSGYDVPSEFAIDFVDSKSCAKVMVTKSRIESGGTWIGDSTTIESHGYNTACDSTDSVNSIERALRVGY